MSAGGPVLSTPRVQPIFYPGDYGFVPRTLALDDDPLDVLILVSEPTFSGCLVLARPIGLLRMIDDGKEDDKVLAVPVGEPDYADVHNFTQIFSHQLRKIQHFFETYKLLEGKHTSTGGWEDAATARRVEGGQHTLVAPYCAADLQRRRLDPEHDHGQRSKGPHRNVASQTSDSNATSNPSLR